MDIQSTIRYLSTKNEQIEENILPKKPNRLKETKIVNPKTLLILNLPTDPKQLLQLHSYPYFGQFKNIKEIQLLGPATKTNSSTLVEFTCDISAALSFFVG